MAIYWVDPYIEAEINGIHGTTDTTTKSGSYSAPWALSDIFFTSLTTGNLPGGLTLTNGDEIRLKGLPRADFLQSAGSTWYYNNRYRVQTTNNTSNIMNDHLAGSAGTNWTAANSKNGFVFTFDPTFTDQFAIADSDGDKPLHFFNAQYTQNSAYINAYSGGGLGGFMEGVFRSEYPNSGVANAQMYIVHPQYYIDFSTVYTSSSTRYFGVQTNIDITITDGWTSSTARNGYTILPFYSNFGSFTPRLYFNANGNNTTADVLYDLPKTYFIPFDDNSNVSRFYYYVNSAHGNNAGNTNTQRFGGLIKTDYGYPTYEYTSYYYDGIANDATATNNSEINYAYGYYAIYGYGRYGQATSRYNNLLGYQRTNMYNYSAAAGRKVQIGNVFQYSGSSGALIQNYSNPTGTTNIEYEFLQNVILYNRTSGGGLFQYQHGGTLTINAPIHNYTSTPFLSGAVVTTGTGPVFLEQITQNNYGYQDNILASPDSWYEAKGVFHDGRTSTPHSSFQENMTMGVLDFGTTDYKTLSPTFQVKTDKYLYSYTGSYNADTNIHFSSNTFDGRPIGACLSYSRNNNFHYPVLYYNDSENNNALCFQSNGSGDLNAYYKKNIEVAIPEYTTQPLTFKAEFETTEDWDKQFRIDLQYINSSGTTSTLQLVNVSSYVSKVVYETTIPNANLPQTLKPRHMNAIISFQNSDSPNKKVWVHDISLSISA